jgi:hypothetical protein
MADTQYETEGRNSVWPWVLGLVVLALLVWAFAANRTGEDRGAITTGRVDTTTPAAVATTDATRRSQATDGFASTGASTTDPYQGTPADPYAGTTATTTAGATSSEMLAATDASTIPVASIVAQPDQYVRQTVTGTATVVEIEGERGLWVEQDGQRMFVLVGQGDAPVLSDLRAGETVTLTGVVHTQVSATALANDVDAEAQRVVAEQPAFLFVQAADIDSASMASTAAEDDDTW